jgi:hypothetical protein
VWSAMCLISFSACVVCNVFGKLFSKCGLQCSNVTLRKKEGEDIKMYFKHSGINGIIEIIIKIKLKMITLKNDNKKMTNIIPLLNNNKQ